VNILNFLSTKKNIKIMNDKEGQTLKSWISKTEKRVKWKPDVIIYYFLSRQEKWTEISIPDFNKTASNLPRYMIFEDSHYYETVIPLYKKYKFNLLLKPQKKKVLDNHYKKRGINIDYWGYFIDDTKFKTREQDSFKYDILLYGFINKAYPLRVKFFEVLQFLNQRSNLRIKHIPHPGYYKGALNKLPKNEELSKIINKSRFTLVSSSHYQILLKKYMEVPMSGSTMIGDIPSDYPELKVAAAGAVDQEFIYVGHARTRMCAWARVRARARVRAGAQARARAHGRARVRARWRARACIRSRTHI